MPITATRTTELLSSYIDRDLVLSRKDINRFWKAVSNEGGLGAEGSAAIAEFFRAKLQSTDYTEALSQYTREKRLNAFLATADTHAPLPVDRTGATERPDGTLNFIELLARAHDPDPIPPTPEPDPVDPTPTPDPIEPTPDPIPDPPPAEDAELNLPSFGGHSIAVSGDGTITLADQPVELSLAAADDTCLSALWGLNRPGQLDALDPAARTALAANLLEAADLAVTDAPDEAPFRRYTASTAAVAAACSVAPDWRAEDVDRAIQLASIAPQPLMKGLLLRAVNSHELTEAQQAAVAAIEAPEGADALITAFDKTRKGQMRARMFEIQGRPAEYALNALAFAKDEEAFKRVTKGLAIWAGADQGTRWSEPVLGRMEEILEGYVNEYKQSVYQYGTLENHAARDRASYTSERATKAVMAELTATPPTIQGYPLTEEQSEYLQGIIANVRDEEAVEYLVKSLDLAASAFGEPHSSWEDPTAEAPMCRAAFGFFRRAARSYQDSIAASEDGKLGYDNFYTQLSKAVGEIRGPLTSRLGELEQNQWNGVALQASTAQQLRDTLHDKLRSPMALENLDRAIQVFAEQGPLTDPARAELFENMLTEYVGNWPQFSQLDFNKLERIAKATATGQPLPTYTVNGDTVHIATYYDNVATKVADTIDPDRCLEPWMAERWGFRAHQAIELLDVLAERAARDDGPIAALREQFPGRPISVEVTGGTGDHEMFVFVVDGIRHMQGSDGTIQRVHAQPKPVLFRADIDDSGNLAINVQTDLQPERYPLQGTYGVGDSIDVHYYDSNAEENAEEGEKFSTRNKILEGKILAYDAAGKYTVEFKDPEGNVQTKQLTLDEIEDANNPHFYDLDTFNSFSDVTINLSQDEELRTFLDGAREIVRQHFPTDNPDVRVSTMTPQELERVQLACIKDLMAYGRENMSYPDGKDDTHIDEPSRLYHDALERNWRVQLGYLLEIERGVCRHQHIMEHLMLEVAGIDSRFGSGAANTSSGNFRGFHIWTEVTLATGRRYLSDQTWDDPAVPLWSRAYGVDQRRVEMYHRTARYDSHVVD